MMDDGVEKKGSINRGLQIIKCDTLGNLCARRGYNIFWHSGRSGYIGGNVTSEPFRLKVIPVTIFVDSAQALVEMSRIYSRNQKCVSFLPFYACWLRTCFWELHPTVAITTETRHQGLSPTLFSTLSLLIIQFLTSFTTPLLPTPPSIITMYSVSSCGPV